MIEKIIIILFLIPQYLWHETEMRRKEKEHRKKLIQKQVDVDSDQKKGQNQHDSIEKTMSHKKVSAI